MTSLRELYQEIILDHGKRPRKFGAIENPDRSAEGFNPLCGDRVTVFMNLDGDVVRECAFTGAGCAICTASASLMAEAVGGMTIAAARDLNRRFLTLLTGPYGERVSVDEEDELGKLIALRGVRQYPMRVKCADPAVAYTDRGPGCEGCCGDDGMMMDMCCNRLNAEARRRGENMKNVISRSLNPSASSRLRVSFRWRCSDEHAG